MGQITVITSIDAPLENVFQTVADIRNFSKAVPDIVDIEMLSDVTTGKGAHFRETRLMNGKEASTVLEVIEFVENERIRLIADSHGTVWDSVFTVKEENNGTTLKLVMEAKAYKLLPKLLNPLMKGVMKKALQKDMLAVKNYCEDQ